MFFANVLEKMGTGTSESHTIGFYKITGIDNRHYKITFINRQNKTTPEICSKLTIMTPERRSLNRFHTFFCFHCWIYMKTVSIDWLILWILHWMHSKESFSWFLLLGLVVGQKSYFIMSCYENPLFYYNFSDNILTLRP